MLSIRVFYFCIYIKCGVVVVVEAVAVVVIIFAYFSVFLFSAKNKRLVINFQ